MFNKQHVNVNRVENIKARANVKKQMEDLNSKVYILQELRNTGSPIAVHWLRPTF